MTAKRREPEPECVVGGCLAKANKDLIDQLLQRNGQLENENQKLSKELADEKETVLALLSGGSE